MIELRPQDQQAPSRLSRKLAESKARVAHVAVGAGAAVVEGEGQIRLGSRRAWHRTASRQKAQLKG